MKLHARAGVPLRSKPLAVLMAACIGTLAAGCAREPAAAGLPALKLDPTRTSVSGLSSGAYMATQVHLAFSDHIVGAALFAGGPYGCARGSLETALAGCLAPAADKLPDVAALAGVVRERAAAGKLAALDGLAGDAVLVFHGSLDTTVGASVSAAAADLYRQLGGTRIQVDDARAVAHTMPTVDKGAACDKSEAPFIGACNVDGAGAAFAAAYGPAPAAAGIADGELRRFGQDAYRPEGRDAMLGETGYVYVPKACASGETCALHIAFHGCQQNAEAVGEAFARDAGYNRWADAYRVVVLYPQTRASFAPLNPKACWDWWGYGGADYDTRNGVQMRWLANAAAALGAPLE